MFTLQPHLYLLPVCAIKRPSFRTKDRAIVPEAVSYALMFLHRLVYAELGPNSIGHRKF